CARTSNFDYW
nr:immunoglobulin heavy chain junction region [Mus musculus]